MHESDYHGWKRLEKEKDSDTDNDRMSLCRGGQGCPRATSTDYTDFHKWEKKNGGKNLYANAR